MNKHEFLNSNRVVISYFVKLVHRLSPKYMPTLLFQSLCKSLRPIIFVFGPKLIVDELMQEARVDRLVTLIVAIAFSNFTLSTMEKLLKVRTDLLTDQFNNAFERHISKKTIEIDFENIEDPEILNLKERALFAVRNHGLMFVMVEALSKVVNESFLIVGLSAIIWTFSPWVLVLLIGVVFINSFIFKKVQKYYYTESTQTVAANRAFVYYITQSSDLEIAKDLRLYNMDDMVIEKMDQYNLRTYKLYLKIYGAISRLNGIVSVNVQIQTVIIYFMLAFRTLRGTVTIGNFMMYAGAVGKFSGSMNTLVSSIIEANRLCRQLELLVEYEKIPASKDIGDLAVPDVGAFEIEFHNVSFRYPRANYEGYMSKIAAVFQDYRLFGLTVEENITGKLSGEQIDKCLDTILKEVGAYEDIAKLPSGLKTPLDKSYDREATKLSGGQAQKVAIARALYKYAPIVVLDEPTAALDPIAEHDIYCRFDELVENKTAIYISHRLSSCRFCDRILVFDQGEIIQVGSHDELIRHKGSQYETMFSAQAAYYSA